MSNTAPSKADPVVVFPLADGAHHKKPHSPTHPHWIDKKNDKWREYMMNENSQKTQPASFYWVSHEVLIVIILERCGLVIGLC